MGPEDNATKFFAMSGLSRPDLKQVWFAFWKNLRGSKVWAIADSKRQGFLGFGEFVTAMQEVSLAQAGNEITQNSLKREDLSSWDPPAMEGLNELLARSKAMVKRVYLEENGRFSEVKGHGKESLPRREWHASGPSTLK